MIFVTVGSTDFDALVHRMDEIGATEGEELVMQIGSGQYMPQHAARVFRYAPSLDEFYDQADIVVSHGGLGTVVEALRHRRKLIAVSNPDRYDAHQEDILGAFAEAGYMIWCRDLVHLADELRRARETAFAPYEEPSCQIHQVIQEFLARRVRR